MSTNTPLYVKLQSSGIPDDILLLLLDAVTSSNTFSHLFSKNTNYTRHSYNRRQIVETALDTACAARGIDVASGTKLTTRVIDLLV